MQVVHEKLRQIMAVFSSVMRYLRLTNDATSGLCESALTPDAAAAVTTASHHGGDHDHDRNAPARSSTGGPGASLGHGQGGGSGAARQGSGGWSCAGGSMDAPSVHGPGTSGGSTDGGRGGKGDECSSGSVLGPNDLPKGAPASHWRAVARAMRLSPRQAAYLATLHGMIAGPGGWLSRIR